MAVNRFVLNGISYHGHGAINEIPGIVTSKGFKKAFVASDPDLVKFGVTAKVTDLLKDNGIDYELYSDIKPNPTIENVLHGVEAYKASGADFMITIGGGSSMDTGKAIGIIINNPEFSDVRSLEGVAPTKKRTVFTIAVTHAIEGYTTAAAWELSDCLDLEAIKLIAANLRKAVDNDPDGREGMALAQYVTAMAYSNVGLGIAHSMAHTLGAVYDTPHGVACAMMLPIVMEFNKEYTGEKYKAIAEAFGVDTTGMDQETYRQAAIDAVQQLSIDVGIPTKLEKLKEEDLPFLCESAAADACAPGNPRPASLEQFEEMFRKLM